MATSNNKNKAVAASKLAVVPEVSESNEPKAPNFQKIANRPTSHLHNLIEKFIADNTDLSIPADTVRQVLALNAEFRRSAEYAAYKAAGGSGAFRQQTLNAQKRARLLAKLAELDGTGPAVNEPETADEGDDEFYDSDAEGDSTDDDDQF